MIVIDKNTGAPVQLAGAPVVVIWNQTLLWAVEELVKLGPSTLKSLKVSAGEHLAAILTTSFMGIAPAQVDTDGGPDLLFHLPEKRKQFLPFSSKASTAVFEVKSMPGRFREFNSMLNRAQARGEDTSGLHLSLQTQTARQVLEDAKPMLLFAQERLVSKTVDSDETSRNLFLVVHPFDALAVDLEHPVIGPLLPDLGYLSDVDSAWILWAPERLTVWSREKQGWTDLLFQMLNPDETPSEELTPLQAAEIQFLNACEDKNGSPYLFRFQVKEP